MNGWKMLHSKHGRVLPPDKRDGKRKRETEVEGGEGRDEVGGGPQSVLRLQRNRGRNRKEKLRWECSSS